MENNDFDKKKEQIVNAICDVLIEKNKRYYLPNEGMILMRYFRQYYS